ncbi:hypothetical protein Q31b_42530 [Novipirellula aureliae]|uniref:Uncharacterized protein n=1 Tax=Novipirellula aureliae TaxID=2527966 RepID=A0A5C6DMS7_9BACT|nr:hypothetical protein Q31b_42530 [Novipirellula aureliae]
MGQLEDTVHTTADASCDSDYGEAIQYMKKQCANDLLDSWDERSY